MTLFASSQASQIYHRSFKTLKLRQTSSQPSASVSGYLWHSTIPTLRFISVSSMPSCLPFCESVLVHRFPNPSFCFSGEPPWQLLLLRFRPTRPWPRHPGLGAAAGGFPPMPPSRHARSRRGCRLATEAMVGLGGSSPPTDPGHVEHS